MKPTVRLTIFGIFLIFGIFSIPLWFFSKPDNPYGQKKVTQKVVENSYEFDFPLPYINPEKYDSLVKERQRKMEAPYALITSYEYENVYDFGDYKYIDSIKCIRFSEMKKRAKEIERENAIERYKAKKRELELEKLNKPCQ
jgi:hypothetical protein